MLYGLRTSRKSRRQSIRDKLTYPAAAPIVPASGTNDNVWAILVPSAISIVPTLPLSAPARNLLWHHYEVNMSPFVSP